MVRNPEDTSIPLKKSTRERLGVFGNKNESWDRLLNRMMDEIEIKESKKIMSINPSVTDCIRQDHCKYDHTKDILGVLTDIPVDADSVLWSLRIKNSDKYNCLSELEILIILRLMKEDGAISGYYDKESECWLWSKKRS